MTVFVICLLTPWQTAIRKKENSLQAGKKKIRKKIESQTFFSPPLSQAWDPQIMKGIKLLSLSQNKHKLFWHLINRQRGIVFRARQVCLVHCWCLLLFCWGSVFAFLSYIVTHLSPERRAAWKMANSNYTDASWSCLVFCFVSVSSQTVNSQPYFTRRRVEWTYVDLFCFFLSLTTFIFLVAV